MIIKYYIVLQKRDSGSGTFTSTSDRSSGTKSMSTPSTPKAESGNLLMESRLSHSTPTENTPSAHLSSDIRHERETPEESLQQESPLVCKLNLLFMLMLYGSHWFATSFSLIILVLLFVQHLDTEIQRYSRYMCISTTPPEPDCYSCSYPVK